MHEKTFEKAERKMLKTIFESAVDKAQLKVDEIDFMFATVRVGLSVAVSTTIWTPFAPLPS